MSIKRIAGASCCAGAFVAAMWASAASSQLASTLVEEMTYRPIDSIQYDFGSKATSGYFMQEAARCVVYLMVYEKPDPDAASWRSATRIRLALNPGETAGFDSEEGRSLNFSCGDGGASLVVDSGERDKLVALQDLPLHKTASK